MLGNLPYHEAFDHMPIGLYYIFALFFSDFRLFPYRNALDSICGNRADKLAAVSDSEKQMPQHQHFVRQHFNINTKI
jgi:hypothetical protein